MPSRQREFRTSQQHTSDAGEFTSVSKCSAPPSGELEEWDPPEGPTPPTPLPSIPPLQRTPPSHTHTNNNNNDDDDDVISSTGLFGANTSISSSIATSGGHHRYASSNTITIRPSPQSVITPTLRHKSLPSLVEVMSRVPDGISLPHPHGANHHHHAPLDTSTSSQTTTHTSRSGFVSILRRNVSSPLTNVEGGENESFMASLSNASLGRSALSPQHHKQQPHRHVLGESGSSYPEGGGPPPTRLATIPRGNSTYTGNTTTTTPSDIRAQAGTSFNSGGSPKAALRLRQSLLEDRALNREEDHSFRPMSDAVSSLGVGIGCGSSSGNDDEWGDDDCASEIHNNISTTSSSGRQQQQHRVSTTRVCGGALNLDSDEDDDPLHLRSHFSANGPPILPSLQPLNVYSNSSSRDDGLRRLHGGNGGGPLAAESNSFDERVGEASATVSFGNKNVRGEGSFSGMFTWDEDKLNGEEIESALKRQNNNKNSKDHNNSYCTSSPPLLSTSTTAASTPCKSYKNTGIGGSTTTMLMPPCITVNDGDQPPSFTNHHPVLGGSTALSPPSFTPAMLSLSSPGNVSLQIQSRDGADNESDDDDERVGSLSSALASRILRATEGGSSTGGLFRSLTSHPNTTGPQHNNSNALGGSSTDNISHLIDIHPSHSANWAGGMNSANSDIGNRLAQSMPAHTVPGSYSSCSNTKSLLSRHQVGVPINNVQQQHQSQSYFSLSTSSSSHQRGYTTTTTPPTVVVEINNNGTTTAPPPSSRPSSSANNNINTISISSINAMVVSVQPSFSQDCSSSACASLLDRPLGDADDPLGVSIGSNVSSSRRFQQQQQHPQLDSITVHPSSGGLVPACGSTTVELSISSVGASGSHQTVHSSTALDIVLDEEETTTTVVVVSPTSKSAGVNSLSTDPDDPEYEEILRVQTMRMLEEGHDISDVEALKRRKRRLRRRIKVANTAWESSRVASAPGTPSLLGGSDEQRPIRRTRATIVDVCPQ